MSIQNDVEKLYRSDLEKQRQKQKKKKKKKLLGIMLIVIIIAALILIMQYLGPVSYTHMTLPTICSV